MTGHCIKAGSRQDSLKFDGNVHSRRANGKDKGNSMNGISKRIFAALVCAAVLVVSTPITAYADSTLDHRNDQNSELEKQQQALKEKLNQTKT